MKTFTARPYFATKQLSKTTPSREEIITNIQRHFFSSLADKKPKKQTPEEIIEEMLKIARER
jgi:hypothetical protein